MAASEKWDLADSVDIVNVGELVGKLALFIISDVGFGMPLQIDELPSSDAGDMTLLKAFEVMTQNLLLAVLTPKGARTLPIKALQHVQRAEEKILAVMQEFIQERRAELASKTDEENKAESRGVSSIAFFKQMKRKEAAI